MTSSPPNTPEQLAKAKRQEKYTRTSARMLAKWLDPSLEGQAHDDAADRWLDRLGESSLCKLAYRVRRMAEWELARAEQMRDAGASAWILLKFVGAEQDMTLDGPACRDTIYADTLSRSAQRKRRAGRERLVRLAVPVAVVSIVATAVTAGVGYMAAAAAPLAGIDPSSAAAAWQHWQEWFSPVLQKAADLARGSDALMTVGAFAMGAFWMWAHDCRITSDLRAKTAEREVPSLETAIGFEAKGHRIQPAIRAIPEHQRVLVAHLTSTDLRAFLLGTDEERIHMLRENRPPLLAEISSVLASRPRSLGAVLPTLRDLADICLPKRWARAIGAHHPGEIDADFMAQWRRERGPGAADGSAKAARAVRR